MTTFPRLLAGSAALAAGCLLALGSPTAYAAEPPPTHVPAPTSLAVSTESAEAAAADCPQGALCWWTGPDYTGARSYGWPVPSGQCLPFHDASGGPSPSRSIINNGTIDQRLWQNVDCTGQNFVLPPGSAVPDAIGLPSGYLVTSSGGL